jgi:20S proteasome subunit alpha 2
MGDSGFGYSLTTFSPSGKLGQIDHALAVVQQGPNCIGIKCSNGAVLASEKKPPTLVDASTVEKISLLDDHIGVVYSGMGPDARVLVKSGRKECQVYRQTFREPIPVKQIVRHLAAVMQEYTQSGGVRPFGVSLIVAGWDHNGPHVFQVDPSGSEWAWKACALGKNMNNANTFLEKRYSEDMELEDAIHTALLTLKESFDGKMSEENIELGVSKLNDKGEKVFTILPQNVVREYLEELQ